jgi:hypothetical protein
VGRDLPKASVPACKELKVKVMEIPVATNVAKSGSKTLCMCHVACSMCSGLEKILQLGGWVDSESTARLTTCVSIFATVIIDVWRTVTRPKGFTGTIEGKVIV